MKYFKRIASYIFMKLPAQSKLRKNIEKLYGITKSRLEEKEDMASEIKIKCDLDITSKYTNMY